MFKVLECGEAYETTQQLHDLGQSLWLDDITRGLLTSAANANSIDELSTTGLTSNPTVLDHAGSSFRKTHCMRPFVQVKGRLVFYPGPASERADLMGIVP